MSEKNTTISGAETSVEKSDGFRWWRGVNTSILLIAFFFAVGY